MCNIMMRFSFKKIEIQTSDIGNQKNKKHHSDWNIHNYLPFFFFKSSSSWISNNPHPREAPTTAMPVNNKYDLFSIPSNIEEMITAVVIYFAISNSQLANLSFLFFLLFINAKVQHISECSKQFAEIFFMEPLTSAFSHQPSFSPYGIILYQ